LPVPTSPSLVTVQDSHTRERRILIRLPAPFRDFVSSPRTSVLFAKILAAATVALGVAAVVTSIWIIIRTYSPVLFWDQWEVLRTLANSGGHPSLRDFWSQHNEHRVVTGRLLDFADLFLFGGRNVSLFVEIVVLQLCHLALLLWVVRRFGSLPRTVYVTLAGFLTYCLFSPIQIENFIWAFQTVFILTSLSATACCAAALCHHERATSGGGRGTSAYLFLAIAWAFIGEITEAHGLITWAALLFLAFALSWSRRDKVIAAAAACVAIAAYLIGYRSPDPPEVLRDALSHPAKVLHFVVVYLARSWDGHLPSGSVWPSVSESVTFLVIAMTFGCAVWCLRRPRRFSPLQIAMLANLLFGLGTAAMTAVGRLQYGGLQAAMAIRYQTPALVFWGSLAIFLASEVDWRPPKRLLVAQVALLIMALAGGARWYEMGHFAEARQYGDELAWNAIIRGQFTDPVVRHVYFDPPRLSPLVVFLRGHGWGPAGAITSFARLQTDSRSPQIQGYRVQAHACFGHWDQAWRSGLTSVFVNGWGLSQLAGEVPHRVAFAARDGKIISYAGVNTVRADVAARYPAAKGVRAGWETNLSVPGDGMYHVFLLFDNAGVACPLPGELRIAHYPVF